MINSIQIGWYGFDMFNFLLSIFFFQLKLFATCELLPKKEKKIRIFAHLFNMIAKALITHAT
jgi:hypothetical protein